MFGGVSKGWLMFMWRNVYFRCHGIAGVVDGVAGSGGSMATLVVVMGLLYCCDEIQINWLYVQTIGSESILINSFLYI